MASGPSLLVKVEVGSIQSMDNEWVFCTLNSSISFHYIQLNFISGVTHVVCLEDLDVSPEATVSGDKQGRQTTSLNPSQSGIFTTVSVWIVPDAPELVITSVEWVRACVRAGKLLPLTIPGMSKVN